MNFWTPERRDYLRQWGGKKPDDRIADDLGCATITVRKERTVMGLDAYRGRPGMSRRQALLNSAAGLDFCVSLCRI